MTWVRLSAGLLLLAVCLRTAPVDAQAQRRAIYASALDQNGAPVANLGPPDFVVREDKIAREVLAVEPAVDPMQVVLLVDNSQAAEPFIRDIREGLTSFISALAADESAVKHQVSIVTLAERPTINTEYTFDLGLAIKGAQRIFATPGSGTYLLDGIIETSRGIARRSFARPVVIAITTEGPELSDRQYMTALEPLRAAGAAFHVLIIGLPRNTSHDRSLVLDMGTRATGGRYDTLLTSNGLPTRMRQMAAELTHQYRVTYGRPESLIPPEQVTIAAAKPGLSVRGTPVKTQQERP